MKRRLFLALLLVLAPIIWAEEGKVLTAIDLNLAGSKLRFLTAAEAGEFLAVDDEYFRAQGPLDRGLILQKTEETLLEDVKKHVKTCGRDWAEDEKTAFAAAFAKFAPKAADLKLRLPAEILLLKTNGDEDFGLPYTRRNAIVIPEKVAQRARGMGLVGLCAHELFHVYSRHNPEQRDAIYAVFGFEPVVNPPKPEGWEKLRITNADAPDSRHALRAKIADGSEVRAVPYLISRLPAYDPKIGKNPAGYYKLVWQEVPAQAEAKARTFVVRDFTDFAARTGGNSQYTIHPEEISADNFMLLLIGAPKVASPEKVAEFEALLRKAAK